MATPKAKKQRNKHYYHVLKDMVTDECFPLLYEQGWIRTPFKSSHFGAASHGFIWTLYKFEKQFVQSLDIYLSRHWSGYDRYPSLQIDYTMARLPETDEPIWELREQAPLGKYGNCIDIMHKRRPFGLCLDRRYGFKGTSIDWLLRRRVRRCREELLQAFEGMDCHKQHWVRHFETPEWALE